MKLSIYVILAAITLALAKGGNHTEHEHLPQLKVPCDCPTPVCPGQLLDTKAVSSTKRIMPCLVCTCSYDPLLTYLFLTQVCQCKQAAAQACFIKSQGGCPKPKENVRIIFCFRDYGLSNMSSGLLMCCERRHIVYKAFLHYCNLHMLSSPLNLFQYFQPKQGRTSIVNDGRYYGGAWCKIVKCHNARNTAFAPVWNVERVVHYTRYKKF